jgi:hypothetical protein
MIKDTSIVTVRLEADTEQFQMAIRQAVVEVERLKTILESINWSLFKYARTSVTK